MRQQQLWAALITCCPLLPSTCSPVGAQLGFLVVMGASMLAGFRWTITQVLLQGDAKHSSARFSAGLIDPLRWADFCHHHPGHR